MPNWLIPVLKWGGLALAIVFIIALYLVGQFGPAPEAEAGAPETTGPVVLYWILVVVGVVGAIAGFVLGGRKA